MPVVRPPAYTDGELGAEGWRALQELAAQRGTKENKQNLPLVRYALYRYLTGDSVELTRSQLEVLTAGLEAPAA